MVTGAIAFAPALSWLGATPLLPLGGRPRRGCWSLALSAEAWILATKSASLVSSLIVSISALTSYLSRKKPTHGALATAWATSLGSAVSAASSRRFAASREAS